MSWLWLTVLGGCVGLDATSFPQVMLSRPLVAGTLAGLVFGDPMAGLLLGAILEVFDLGTLPVGAARYPEGGTATIAATAAYVQAGADSMPALLLAVLFGLAWQYVAGGSVVRVRQLNGRIVDAGATPGAAAIERRHLAALALDFVRGAIMSCAGAGLGWLLLIALVPLWAGPATLATRALVIAAAAAAGATLTVFGGWTERRYLFLFGIACGSLVQLALD